MALLLQAVKLSWRGLRRQPLYATVIVVSLALGFSFAHILTAFVLREQRTDSFHEQKDRLFRLLSDDPFEKGEQLIFVREEVAQHLSDRYPEVAASCRIFDLAREGVTVEVESEIRTGVMTVGVDSTFFTLFDYPVYEGAVEAALRPGQIVLSRSCAERLFGARTAIGERLQIELDSVTRSFSVAAVLEDPPQNSHLHVDALVPYQAFASSSGGATHYLLLTPESDPAALAEKISDDAEIPSLLGPGAGVYELQALSDVYFDESQPRPYYRSRSRFLLHVSLAVVLLVLFTASFNFLNLIVIAHLKRRRTLGIQKVFGASTGELRRLAVGEVLLYTAIAYVASLLLTRQLLPWFNLAFETALSPAYLVRAEVVAGFAGLLLVVSALAVYYLSGYLNRQDPVKLLSDGAIKVAFNKWLFIAQFVVAIALIFCTVIIVRQLRYIQDKPLGFNRQLLELRPPDKDRSQRMAVLRERLRRDPALARAALGSGNPISGNRMVRFELPNDDFYAPYLFSGDSSFVEVLGLELLSVGFQTARSALLNPVDELKSE